MVGGGIFSKEPGTLSGDGKLLLCPSGKVVIIFSAVTGERVGLLAGHTDKVTGVVLDPGNDNQVYTCSLDASVRQWDYRAGTELQRLMLQKPVASMVFQKELGVAYFAVQLDRGEAGGGRVVLYNMRTGKFSGNALKTRSAAPLALSPWGSLTATFDRNSLFVWRTGTEIYQPLNLPHTKQYTCVAISADSSLIAAGDVSGRILIWHSFEQSVPSARRQGDQVASISRSQQPPLTTVHWHAHPVGALTFSSDGTYLLSGGQEGVLVIWQLDNYQRTYLPRLGGPIVGLHPSPTDAAKYIVRHADNVVRIVNVATMKVEATVLGVKPAPPQLTPKPAGASGSAMAVLPAGCTTLASGGGSSGGVLVLSCENAMLQFYDISRDQHIKSLSVIQRNWVSITAFQTTRPNERGGSGRHSRPAVVNESTFSPYVSLLAFSSDGSVLATVDVRPDAGPYGSVEACLKFWDSATCRFAKSKSESEPFQSNAPFVLNTRVDEPHRDVVTGLVFHPHRHMAVTTGGMGLDSEFKVWVQERRPSIDDGDDGDSDGDDGGAAPTLWRCRSMGGYKGLKLTAAAFSADGSVLAVAAVARVTLWDAASNTLAAVLPIAVVGPEAANPISQMVFIPGTPFLATAAPSCLAVYNILTAAVHWSLPLDVTSIAADGAYGLLSVALRAVSPSRQKHLCQQQQQKQLALNAAAETSADAEGGATVKSDPALQPSEPPAPAADADVTGTSKAAASTPGPPGKAAGRRSSMRHSVPPPAPLPRPLPPSTATATATATASTSDCHVIVFDPREGLPRYHCRVPRCNDVYVTHLQGPAQGTADRGPGVEGCSPLLIVRDNRRYSLAALQGWSGTVKPAEELQGAIERDTAPSAFEAAFGRPTGQQKSSDAVPMDVGVPPGAAVGRPIFADLFDAPSHVLPPPTSLATAFLTLLTKAEV